MRALLAGASRRLGDERGIALVMALGILFVLSIALTSIVYFTSTNSRTAARDRSAQQAHTLAEAGVNNALAVLYNPANDARNPALLPPTEKSYEGGTARWSGQLTTDGVWTVSGTGTVKNPTGPGAADVTRTLTAKSRLFLPNTTGLRIEVWNWVYSGRTGNVCDMTIDQQVALATPLYVAGNLCMRSGATIARGPLGVGGRLTLEEPKNAVGAKTQPIEKAYVGNGCQYHNNPLYVPCVSQYLSPAVKTNVFSKYFSTNVSELGVATPVVDWDFWHRWSSPGPYQPCTTASGPVPMFETDVSTGPNESVPGVFDLTPAGASYKCQTFGGELSWDHVKKVLTVRGTVFIDGSAKIENGLVSTYTGQSALYLGGTLLIKNSKLCAVLTADRSACDRTTPPEQGGWNPNKQLLVIGAKGQGGQLPAGVSIQVVSAEFQGGLYGEGAITTSTTSKTQGPMVSPNLVALGQSNDVSFPSISIVPVGIMGNQVPPFQLSEPDFEG